MAMIRTSTIDSRSDDVCLGPLYELMVKRGVIVLGDTGGQLSFGPQRVSTLYEDFNGGTQVYSTTVVDGWMSRKGTTNAVDWTVTAAAGGTVVGKVGDTTASMAVSGVQLDSGLNWKANQGNLVFEAKVKTGIITNIAIFIGFTDQVAALEMPIQSAASADTITTNASDAVGFMFDTSMTTDTWWLVGVANNTDATLQNSAAVPVADTYQTFRIELSTTGVATFYINGVAVGTAMTGAVTATVALTPVIAAFNRTTTNGATTIVTADYVYVSADRA
jgi:hypothetical protein